MSGTQPPPPSAQPPPPSAQPPGWYHDGYAQRWWDGSSWGPYAPAAPGQSNDKLLSTFAHGGVLFGGFLLPLILYLIANDQERPETRWHAREALNFQITFIIAYFGSFLLIFGGVGLSGISSSGAGVGVGVFFGFGVGFLLALGSIIANFVFSIMGAVKSNRGERWRYPVSFRFVK